MAVEELLTTKLTTTDTTERDGGMLPLSARLPGLVDVARKLASRLRSSLPCRGRCRPTRLGPVPGHDLGHRPGATVSARAPAALRPIGYQSVVLGPPLNGPVTAEVIQPP